MATIACAIINSFVPSGGKTIKPSDIFDSLTAAKLSPGQLAAKIESVAAALGASSR